MIYFIPDGTSVEVTIADSYGGPDNCFSRQNVNTNAVFWRLKGSEWRHSNFRHLHMLLDWLACCETLQDYLEGEGQCE